MKMKAKFFLMAGLAIGSLLVSCSSDDDSCGDAEYGALRGAATSAVIDGAPTDPGSASAPEADAVPSMDPAVPSADDEPAPDHEAIAIEDNSRMYSRLTAGEWNDLADWKFWTNLLNNNNFYEKPDYWKFFPKNLVVAKVVDADDNAIANVPVELMKGDAVEFATKTDNSGMAYCWINLFGSNSGDLNAEDFSLRINGAPSDEALALTTIKDSELNVNIIVNDEISHPAPKADVAFIVDATGSMMDEIAFLVSDLDYIIGHAAASNKVALRTAALFYRDEDDEYLTKHNDFAGDVAVTQKFVSQQSADGGGDYPEAVHTALEASLQNLSWDESARARIAFLILDAPPHYTENVISSLQKSITLYAKNGIKLIPVSASGIDKDTEFLLRFFDLATGSTYVFLTDDSGIGDSHIEASVGDYEVEYLADLLVRLIKKYVE